MNDNINYIIIPIFGHVVLRTWSEFDGDKLVGMGSKKSFDENGNLINYMESPTGAVIIL